MVEFVQHDGVRGADGLKQESGTLHCPLITMPHCHLNAENLSSPSLSAGRVTSDPFLIGHDL